MFRQFCKGPVFVAYPKSVGLRQPISSTHAYSSSEISGLGHEVGSRSCSQEQSAKRRSPSPRNIQETYVDLTLTFHSHRITNSEDNNNKKLRTLIPEEGYNC